MPEKRSCFIISQIGKQDSDERKWADFLRQHIVKPAVTACGYGEPKRADDPEIGLIMTSIVAQMFEADLVVADLTKHNANVIYELGMRHCAQKPTIHLISVEDEIPFDLGENKVIPVGRDHEVVMKAIGDIRARVTAIEENPEQYHSEVQKYVQLKKLEIIRQESSEKEQLLIDTMRGLMLAVAQQDTKLKTIMALVAGQARFLEYRPDLQPSQNMYGLSGLGFLNPSVRYDSGSILAEGTSSLSDALPTEFPEPKNEKDA